MSSVFSSRTGTEVTTEQLASFKFGKTTREDVVSAIGNPTRKSELMGKEIWTYYFTMSTALGANRDENTVFEFDKKGVLLNAYKAGAMPGDSGNPLLNAAGR
ncbi:outer membrane protein assembly factor BamE [Luteibacter aegosomatis]|uniref:outer membrane protein assembly factor BamE domain-containing protein n=1 Tax=Luteibacter aegosomatis TaxID=2911537 RepID=UPI001FF8351C|nr:outer membrane protein assembly factor BamE [Luteibacter aegosomatis]UPG86394.1 outer membrane protein assembly factor BamE [Luteibacter aegosomatis]